MAEAINCNYSRAAIHELCQSLYRLCGKKKLQHSAILQAIEEYNKTFADQGSRMTLTADSSHIRVRKILSLFNQRWHPNDKKKVFLRNFSLEAWKLLPAEVKNKHTMSLATMNISLHFLTSKLRGEKKSIAFNDNDLSSPTNLGRKALDELNTICKQQFQVSAQDVLTSTPHYSQQRQSEKRKLVREAKKAIQQSMDDGGISTVMSNRRSWKKFDRMRKCDALENQTPKRKRGESSLSDENTAPPAKRTHASPLNLTK